MTTAPISTNERRNPFRSNLIIEPLSKRVGLAGGALVLYGMGFIPLYAAGGAGVSALSIFPVVVLAWLFGAWGGLLAGVLIVPLNLLLLVAVGEPGLLIVLGAGGVEGSALVIVVGAVVGLLRDLGVRLDHHLTEWRKAERALRDSEDRYRLLFERSRDPIYVSRPDGTIVDANEAMVTLFGYSRTELLDIDVLRLYEDPEARDLFALGIRRNGFVQDFPVRLLTKAGDVRECLISATARFDGDKIREYQGAIHDVSDSTGLHALAERRTRELREANAELEAFSYSVSHDLRTHLVTMGGFASVLWSDSRDQLDEKSREYLQRIVQAGQKMDRFVHDLLDLSKVTRATIKPALVDLRVVVGEVLAILDAQIKERRALVTIEGDLGTVGADRMLLVRSIQNLVSNAIKFVPTDRTPQVKILLTREGGHLRIAVQDNGIGIDAADVTRAFRAFERVAPAEYPGTGVGLAIVQKSAERLGGRVGVDSKVGEGSTFWMSIPLRGD